jgi:hypothetical protein
VIEASNGVEALEALEQSNVDLVVSDVVAALSRGPISELASGIFGVPGQSRSCFRISARRARQYSR